VVWTSVAVGFGAYFDYACRRHKCGRSVLLGRDPFRLQPVTGRIDHVCVVTTDGAAYCWGNNREGQLGNGTATDRVEG